MKISQTLKQAKPDKEDLILEDVKGRKIIVTVGQGVSSSIKPTSVSVPELKLDGSILEITPFKDKQIDYAIKFRIRQNGKIALIGIDKRTYAKIDATITKLQKALDATENKALATYQEMVARMNGAYEELSEKADRALAQEDTEKSFQIRKQRDRKLAEDKKALQDYLKKHPEIKAEVSK